VDHAVPCEAGVVDDDVNLAVAELGRLFDQFIDIRINENVACYGNGASAGLVDLARDFIRFFCRL